MGQKSKKSIPEPKLLKAIQELEAVAKGDALDDADPEGGLATEGKPLSAQAPSGKSDTKKSRGGSSSSSSSASSSSVEKGGDDDDDDSSSDDASSTTKAMSADSESEEPPPFKKKGKKVAKAASMSASSDDDDSSDDDSSDAEKSLRQAANADEEMSKAIDISPFLEALTDQISAAMVRLEKKIEKSITAAVGQLTAHVDNRVAKSMASSQNFNTRLAKAVSAIGESVQSDLIDMVKSLADQPAPQARGKAVLSKGEVNQPPWSGLAAMGGGAGAVGSDDTGGEFTTELSELSSEAIGDWLFKGVANNKLDPKLIMAWEADRYNVEALPPQVRKALVNDLCK